MENISGFGLTGRLIASSTYPNGFDISAFADDADPLDTPDLELAETSMGLNGDLIVWSRSQGIEITMNIIPTSPDDEELSVLFEANRIGKGKRSARDIIGISLSYPTGAIAQLSSGVMISGTALPAVVSAGRFKSRPYRFRFQNITKTNVSA
jgi:hypothetical protein